MKSQTAHRMCAMWSDSSKRNEFLISSYHPLRPTLMAQTGTTESERAATLKWAIEQVSVGGAREQWVAPEELSPAF